MVVYNLLEWFRNSVCMMLLLSELGWFGLWCSVLVLLVCGLKWVMLMLLVVIYSCLLGVGRMFCMVCCWIVGLVVFSVVGRWILLWGLSVIMFVELVLIYSMFVVFLCSV